MKHSISLQIALATMCICTCHVGFSREATIVFHDHIEHETIEAFPSNKNNYKYWFQTKKWDDFDGSTIKRQTKGIRKINITSENPDGNMKLFCHHSPNKLS